MPALLKQSTAFTFRIGPFVDSSDGVSAETGLSIAQADIQISKNGGAFAQTSDSSPTTTHDTDGWYQCPLTSTDTNTLGPLTVQVTMAGALPVWREFQVVPANVYDSLVAGSDYLQADAVQIEGSDATDQINAACDTAFSDYDPPTKAEMDTGFAGLNDPTAAAIADAVLDEALSGHTTAGTLGKAVADIEADATAILLDTGEIGAAGAGLTALPWNSAWDAEVQSECTDALNAITGSAPTSVPVPGTVTLPNAVAFLVSYFVNKRTQTSTTFTLYENDGSTVLGEATLTDSAGTFTFGAMADP